MTTFWVMFQLLVILGVLGFFAFYAMKKVKGQQFNRIGEKGNMEVVDGMSLSNQTSAYLMNVDGERLFVVISPNGVDTTVLRDKKFEQMLKSGLEEDFQSEEDDDI